MVLVKEGKDFYIDIPNNDLKQLHLWGKDEIR